MDILEELKLLYAYEKTPEQSLAYLANAIEEFDQLFGKYIDIDNLSYIGAVSDNLLVDAVFAKINDIKFEDVIDNNNSTLGSFSVNDGIIRIKNGLDEETIKTVMFHELLHALASHNIDTTGFRQVFETNNYKGLNIIIGHGWDEGFVQMLTKMREKKFSKNSKYLESYPILTELVEQFCELFGMDEMLDMFLNKPNEFPDFLKRKNIPLDFLASFDVIKEYEDSIARFKKMDPLFKDFFDFGYIESPIDNVSLSRAEDDIIQRYVELLIQSKKVSLPELLSKVRHIYSTFDREMSLSALEKIIHTMTPEMLDNDEHLEYKDLKLIHSYLEFEKFENMSIEEKLQSYSKLVEVILDDTYDDYNSIQSDFLKRMLEMLYEDIPDLSDKNTKAIGIGFIGVINYILKNNLPFEELHIEYYNHHGSNGLFKIYKDKGNGEFENIAVLYNNEFEDIKCRPYDKVEGEELEQTIQKLHNYGYKNINKVLGDGEGNYIAEFEADDGKNYHVFISNDEHDKDLDVLTDPTTLESIKQLRRKRDEAIQRVGDISDVELRILLFSEEKKAKRNRNKILDYIDEGNIPPRIIQMEQEIYRRRLSSVSDLKLVAKYREKIAKRERKNKKEKMIITPKQIYSFIERMRGQKNFSDKDGKDIDVSIPEDVDFPTN